jgi:hypothetical protein
MAAPEQRGKAAMNHRHAFKTTISAIVLGALVGAAPAQARDFRGLLPGLIAGSIAAGAFAAAARQAEPRHTYAVAPEPFPDFEEEVEIIVPRRERQIRQELTREERPERRERPAALRVPERPKLANLPPALREEAAPVRRKPAVPIAAAPPAALATCSASIQETSKRHGALRVEVTPAGIPKRGQDGTLTVPLNAAVSYRDGTGSQVRRARVSCRLDSAGQVVALR